MTKADIYAAWQRYMHRADIAGDLDLTYDLAAARIRGNILWATVDLDTILADNPELFLHAGLMQLAELAEDDERLPRESSLFDDALQNYALRRSIDAGQQSIKLGGYNAA